MKLVLLLIRKIKDSEFQITLETVEFGILNFNILLPTVYHNFPTTPCTFPHFSDAGFRYAPNPGFVKRRQ